MEPTYWRPNLLTSPYWNRYAETLPREQLDALALQRVRALLRYVQATSRFYREAWAQAGFDPADVQTLDDVRTRVPLTDKDEVLRYQAEEPPYGRTQALGEEFLAHHS